jgi:uncharacterized membrane protein
MRIISWVWFLYFLIGCLTGGFLVAFWNSLKRRSVRLVWYEWILCVVSFMFYILLLQSFIASLAEGEPQAAWMSVVFLGVPVVLIAVATLRSVQTRLKKG